MVVNILQFRESNFLCRFIGWMVLKINDNAEYGGQVQMIRSIADVPCVPTKILSERGERSVAMIEGCECIAHHYDDMRKSII